MAVDQTLNNVVQTLINVTGGTEIGTTLPPRQNGQFRIPFVKNLRLGPVSNYFGGTQFTLLWDDPDTTESISHYNVFAIGALNNRAPLGPYSATTSPAVFRITPSAAGVITFFVQTQLHNGNVSQIESSPSIATTVSPPQLRTGDVSNGMVFPNSGVTYSYVTAPTVVIPQVSSTIDPTVMWFCDCGSNNITLDLPSGPYAGQIFYIKKTDVTANNVLVVASAGDNIEGAANYTVGAAGVTCIGIMYWLQFTSWQVFTKF